MDRSILIVLRPLVNGATVNVESNFGGLLQETIFEEQPCVS